MQTIVVATHNAHKVAEIRAILDIDGWEFVSLDELGIHEEPVEDGDSFAENARIKARFAHEKTGLAALADDSGLAVDALGGAPGVYSSRYAGETGDSAANNLKLLKAMEGLSGAERTARFVCSLVFIDESGTETVAEGELAGRIGFELRGENGFGYDPLFYLEGSGFEHSVAELSSEEKNGLSHRFRALQALKAALASPVSLQYPSEPRPREQEFDHADTGVATSPHKIVAFDFDGTMIDGSSPVRLIMRLNRDRLMRKRVIAKTIAWGARYKLGTELDQVKPRRHVFSSFRNFSASDANDIMQNLYFEELRPILRPGALEALEAHRAAGCELIVVSASFEPIISAFCEDLNIPHHICTQMEIVDGSYTGETLGVPPESEQKFIQFVAWADAKFGAGNWELTHAYGDHFSDVPLLEIAQNPIAIDPDRRLDGIAKERGWQVFDWPLKK